MESYSAPQHTHTQNPMSIQHCYLKGRVFSTLLSLYLLFCLWGVLSVWGEFSHMSLPPPSVCSGPPRRTFCTPVRPISSPPGTVTGWQAPKCSGAAFRSRSKGWRTETPFCSHLLHRHVARCLTLSARILADRAGCVDSDVAASVSSHERHVKSPLPWKAEQPPTFRCELRGPTRLLRENNSRDSSRAASTHTHARSTDTLLLMKSYF